MMSTRSGSIDPGVLLTTPAHWSPGRGTPGRRPGASVGHPGRVRRRAPTCGRSAAAAAAGDDRAILALEMFASRTAAGIAAAATALDRARCAGVHGRHRGACGAAPLGDRRAPGGPGRGAHRRPRVRRGPCPGLGRPYPGRPARRLPAKTWSWRKRPSCSSDLLDRISPAHPADSSEPSRPRRPQSPSRPRRPVARAQSAQARPSAIGPLGPVGPSSAQAGRPTFASRIGASASAERLGPASNPGGRQTDGMNGAYGSSEAPWALTSRYPSSATATRANFASAIPGARPRSMREIAVWSTPVRPSSASLRQCRSLAGAPDSLSEPLERQRGSSQRSRGLASVDSSTSVLIRALCRAVSHRCLRPLAASLR